MNNLRGQMTVRRRRAVAWAVAATSVAASVAVAAPVTSVAAPVPAAAPMAAGPYGSEVVFDGHGFGHGIGLSQYGALGYALAGWQWTSILNHYYGGTNAGTIGNQLMSVRLTALDGQGQTAVVSKIGTVQTDAAPGVGWTTIVARSLGGGNYKLYGHPTAPACPGAGESLDDPATGWTVISEVQPGPIQFFTATNTAATGDLTDLLGVCEGAQVRSHRGDIYAATDIAGGLRTVNVQGVESYLRSVVGAEVPWSWGNEGGGAGMQALYAQAVAARSYALAQNRYTYVGQPGSPLKIASATCDTQACQVYRGAALRTSVAAGFTGDAIYEFPNTDWAVGFTAGQIRRWPDGRVVSTMFSSSSGGYTSGGAGFTPGRRRR